ncbi:MAG: AraC family transcriptional regulator [Flavobacterium sp.]|uniref:helix-turn-helix transcriptional regulator n=1 Tax=Flavobacterium sp. TaxID=239 RepID=UPI001224574B|nr:helix-turn-helix transcriptional regulator [Flavobacterium sp.]RZJ65188.1 MAG: AraC family transcriptional regulator [Flavobacterium sp.]
MDYKEYVPDQRLLAFIKAHWSLESADGEKPHSRERVFPDGCIEVLFHYGDLFTKFDSSGNRYVQPLNLIHGQITSFIELEATGKVGILSARFMPFGLRPFVNIDIDSITDKVVLLTDVWPDAQPFVDEMANCTNNTERIQKLEDFLILKLDLSRHDKAVECCVSEISASNGSCAIEKLSERLHVGKRHLERRFRASVGLSLKMYSRIVRFNNALQLIENRDFSTFTNVALDGGFYDQAHFIKDFKDLTGLNPKQYFRENLEMVKFFNL